MCFSADGALTSLSTCGWQAAANCHVRITRVVPYDFTPFPGYCVTGRHGEQKTFRSTGALLHVIQRETHPSPIPERLARMQVADRAPTERWGSSDYCAQVVGGVPPFVASRIAHSAKHITPNAAHPSMRLIRRSCEQLRAEAARCAAGLSTAGASAYAAVAAHHLPLRIPVSELVEHGVVAPAAAASPAVHMFVSASARGEVGAAEVLRPVLSSQLRDLQRSHQRQRSCKDTGAAVVMVSGVVCRREGIITPTSSPVVHELEAVVASGCYKVRCLHYGARVPLLRSRSHPS